jgi:hypothetical protein
MMKAATQTRARIARIRRVQHVQAAAVAARADAHAEALELSADRLAQLRMSLTPSTGMVNGASLSQSAELAMRLDDARNGLKDAMVSARANAEHHASLRMEARRQQEAAEKLKDRAVVALNEFLERSHQAARPRRQRLALRDDQ